MLFGDADIEGSFGELVAEGIQACAGGHGGGDGDDFGVFAGLFYEGVCEDFGVGRGADFGFDLRAGHDVEFADAVHFIFRVFGREVAFALLGDGVDQDRAFVLAGFRVFEDREQVVEVVAVDGADVVEAEFFEEGAAADGMAGAFFAFSSFIMKALGKLPAANGIAAMQEINVVVINRSFLGAFLGTALASIVLGALAALRWGDPGSAWFLAAAGTYLAGTFGVTIAGNVPLNDRLAAAPATDPATEALWAHYLERWTRLNTARAVAAALALMMLCAGFAARGVA